jgi:hypothetical protein
MQFIYGNTLHKRDKASTQVHRKFWNVVLEKDGDQLDWERGRY